MPVSVLESMKDALDEGCHGNKNTVLHESGLAILRKCDAIGLVEAISDDFDAARDRVE